MQHHVVRKKAVGGAQGHGRRPGDAWTLAVVEECGSPAVGELGGTADENRAGASPCRRGPS